MESVVAYNNFNHSILRSRDSNNRLVIVVYILIFNLDMLNKDEAIF